MLVIFRQRLLTLSNLQKAPRNGNAALEFWDLAVGASLWESRRSVCAGNTGEIDAMSIYTRTKTRISPTRSGSDWTHNNELFSRQLSLGLAPLAF